MDNSNADLVNYNLYPGNNSTKGFLADGEDFYQVQRQDLDHIKVTGITYIQIADRIESILRGQCSELFTVNTTSYFGFQYCPLCNSDEKDNDCRSNNESMVINKKTKEKIFIPGLIVHLIKEHHFFEGNTPYRVDPLIAIKVLDIKPNIDYKSRPSTHDLNYEINSHIKYPSVVETWLKSEHGATCLRYSK